MSFEALYPKPIMRLAAAAEGAGRLTSPDVSITHVNPLCGDRIVLDLKIEEGRVAALGYEVKACVLCQASATVLARHAPGTAQRDAELLRDALKAMLEQKAEAPPAFADFTAVQPHRSRHACVLLPLDALIEGLEHAVG
jgi:nitrogen fixation NifU-like protein